MAVKTDDAFLSGSPAEQFLEAMSCLHVPLARIVDAQMTTAFGPNWKEGEIRRILEKNPNFTESPDTLLDDPRRVINVVTNNWRKAFAHCLSGCQEHAFDLKNAANVVSHTPQRLTDTKALGAYESTLAMLSKIGAAAEADVIGRRLALLRRQLGQVSREEDEVDRTAENPPAKPVSPPTASAVPGVSPPEPIPARTRWVLPVGVAFGVLATIGAGAWLMRSSRIALPTDAGKNSPTPLAVTHTSSGDTLSSSSGPVTAPRSTLSTRTNSSSDVRTPESDPPSTYLNVTEQGQPLILIIRTSSNEIDLDATDAVARSMRGTGGGFTPAFVTSGMFQKALAGDASVLRTLGIDSTAAVLLGTSEVRVASDTLAGTTYQRATVQIRVRVYRSGSGSRAFAVEGTQGEFTSDKAVSEAEKMAVEALLSKLNGPGL